MATCRAIRLIGGVLPAALLGRIQANELSNLQSISGASYHLVGNEKPKDAAARAWSYLRGAWTAWRDVAAREQGLPGTGAAREKWLLVLLDELGYGRLPVTRQAEAIDGTEYPISHRWYHVPIHLLGPASTSTSATRACLGRRARPRQCCRSTSTAAMTTCGASSATACGCGCYVTPPRSRVGVRRVRPRGDLRRRAVRRVPADVAAVSRLARREARRAGRESRRLLAGGVARRGRRGRHSRAQPPARRGGGGDHDVRRRLPHAPVERVAPHGAAQRARSPTGSTTRRCCGSSTGCCSCLSPKSAAPCSIPPHPARRVSGTASTSPPRGCAGCRGCARAGRTPICGAGNG